MWAISGLAAAAASAAAAAAVAGTAEPLLELEKRQRWATLSMSLAKHCMCLLLRCIVRAERRLHVVLFYFNICGFAFVPSRQKDAAHTFQVFHKFFYFIFFWTGRRYPPSSRQTSHEEGKEWLRSHSTGGLQDTGSQSPLSPPGASCTTAGKYHYSNLRRFTVQAYVNNVASISDVLLFIILHKCSQ